MDSNNHIHIFRDYIVPSTCKNNGYTLHRCDCGYEHKDNFRPLAGHSYAIVSETAPTCTQNGSRVIRCTVCGEERAENLAPSGHIWGEWNFQKFPTCTEDGVKMRICSRCGLREDVTAGATGHKLTVQKTTKDAVEYFCENCGQIISHPTSSANAKKFFASHKKSIIATLTSIVLVVALLVATFTLFIPLYHYSAAVKAIGSENYTEAYYALRKCNGIKDSEDLFADFRIEYDKTIRTNVEYDDGEAEDYYSEEERSEFEFYENGTIKSIVDFDENDNISYRQEYDEKGNTKVIAFYSSHDGSLTYKYEYEYDEKDHLTSMVTYDEDGTIINDVKYRNKYDQNGNISLAVIYENGSMSGKNEYKYDEKGNVIANLYYDSYGNMTGKEEREYDSKGNLKLIVDFEYDSDEEIENKCVYKYKYFKNGKIKSTIVTVYDEYGNMIEKTKSGYTKDGQLDVMITYDDDGEITDKTSWEYFNPQIVYAPKNK